MGKRGKTRWQSVTQQLCRSAAALREAPTSLQFNIAVPGDDTSIQIGTIQVSTF
jgi:hypothetical protein